jgi:L-Ala-D/L-Glu epimerase
MIIKKVEAIPVSVPQKSYRDAYSTFTSSPIVITRIETDEGIIGYGESSALTPEIYGENLGSIVAIIRNTLAPAVIGKDPFQLEQISQLMDRISGRAPCAKTGIDLALYDIIGKKLGQPVYNLLGGKLFDKIYCAFEIGIATPAEMAKEAKLLVDRGLKVVKIKAGTGDLEKDLERVKAVSEAVGKDIRIRVDPNAHWSVADCKKAAAILAHVNLEYLEQPIPGWDFDGMAEIRNSTGLTLEADEGVWTINDVIEHSKKRSADVVNLKIPKVGGLLKGKKMAAVAEASGMTCMAGAEGEAATAIPAKLHLAASTPNATRASDFTELTLLSDWLLEEPIEMTSYGYISVPSSPGLGAKLREEKLEQYRVRP